MKQWIVTFTILVSSLLALKAKGQNIVNTYVDPCDGKTYIFTAPIASNSPGVLVIIRGKSRAYDFNVERSHVSDTLDKILKWALIEEEYEICERVKNLNEYLENNTF